MSRVIEVINCISCPYCSDDCTCTEYDDHPKIPENVIKNKTIADFCSLTDLDEFTNGVILGG